MRLTEKSRSGWRGPAMSARATTGGATTVGATTVGATTVGATAALTPVGVTVPQPG